MKTQNQPTFEELRAKLRAGESLGVTSEWLTDRLRNAFVHVDGVRVLRDVKSLIRDESITHPAPEWDNIFRPLAKLIAQLDGKE